MLPPPDLLKWPPHPLKFLWHMNSSCAIALTLWHSSFLSPCFDFWQLSSAYCPHFCTADSSLDCLRSYSSPSHFWTRSWLKSLFIVYLWDILYAIWIVFIYSWILGLYTLVCRDIWKVLFLKDVTLVLTEAYYEKQTIFHFCKNIIEHISIISLISYTHFRKICFSEFSRGKYYLFPWMLSLFYSEKLTFPVMSLITFPLSCSGWKESYGKM